MPQDIFVIALIIIVILVVVFAFGIVFERSRRQRF
jgi:hypothetical protein